MCTTRRLYIVLVSVMTQEGILKAEDCTSEEIEGIIIQLLDEWSARNGTKNQ